MSEAINYEAQATPAAPMTTEQRDELLTKWQQAKETISKWKDYEGELRKMIVADASLFNPNKQSGTETVELGNGYKLKAVKKINYKVDNKEGQAFAVLKKLAALSDVSAHKCKDLFRFDANLKLSEYKKLDEQEKAIVDTVLETKQAMPSLELVEPKQDK